MYASFHARVVVCMHARAHGIRRNAIAIEISVRRPVGSVGGTGRVREGMTLAFSIFPTASAPKVSYNIEWLITVEVGTNQSKHFVVTTRLGS